MDRLKQLVGYYYAVRNYIHTPKGRHDFIDYAQAVVIIIGIIAVTMLVIKWTT